MKTVIVTGSSGGIGSSICKNLQDGGFNVLGIDKSQSSERGYHQIQFDIGRLVTSHDAREELMAIVKDVAGSEGMVALVNNAAIQIVESIESLHIANFQKTMDINVTAPLVLSKMFFPMLEQVHGAIVNIGSIHSRLTKPGFISYATSKSALEGLTKALAVDSGNKISVNCILPAAIATEMLKDGFKEEPEKLLELESHHPTGSIGCPTEVADLVNFIITNKISFMNGASIQLDGGISSRLHDPS